MQQQTQRRAGLVGRKDAPAQHHKEQRIDMRPDLALFEIFQQEGFFNREQHKVVKAPGNKVPAGPVPDAGSSPDQEHIEQLSRLALAVAAQGNVDVIPEPARQRNMPAPPELGDAARDIRQVEVGRTVKAEQCGQAVAHLAVARKIKVEL